MSVSSRTEAQRTPRSILRPPNDAAATRTTPSPFHHHHTSSSPELRPRADNTWAPRTRPSPQHRPTDLSQSALTHTSSRHPVHSSQRDDLTRRRAGFASSRIVSHIVSGIRGRSASELRIAAHTPPPDLELDRLARACGQSAHPPATASSEHNRYVSPPIDNMCPPSPGLRDGSAVAGSATHANTNGPYMSNCVPVPKIKVGHMYRRLDALARRSGRRAMDHIGFEDVAVTHRRDGQLREQLRRKQSERLRERDSNFHAIGTPLEDVILYASTPIIIGDYQHHLPIVVVACIEELTKTGIYQHGLFRALPSRDRHLQLIDLFDKSADFGAHFSMRGQTMPDMCALLSTFISSMPGPLLDSQTYAALWHWSVKPSVRREDERRDHQEEEEEERRARGEPARPVPWLTTSAMRATMGTTTTYTDAYLADADSPVENDQIATAQILLRFLPSHNLSLLVYLCAFFTQLPLCPENGLQLEDVARIFGHRLLGGGSGNGGGAGGSTAAAAAAVGVWSGQGSIKVVSQKMMMWLLTRWHRISETLFKDTCGMTPPTSPSTSQSGATGSGAGTTDSEGQGGQLEQRKGKRGCGDADGVKDVQQRRYHHTHHRDSASTSSSSSSYSSASLYSSRGVEGEGGGEGNSEADPRRRQRKKRGLDVEEQHTPTAPTASVSVTVNGSPRGQDRRRRPSKEYTIKNRSADPWNTLYANREVQHNPISVQDGHEYGHACDGLESCRHHPRHQQAPHISQPHSMQENPFSIAFAKAQRELADSPLLSPPQPRSGEATNGMTSTSMMAMAMPSEIGSGVVSEYKIANGSEKMRRVSSTIDDENGREDDKKKKRNEHYHQDCNGDVVDARVVDKLMQETAEATGVARVLVERVAVLERALAAQVRDVGSKGGRVDQEWSRDKGKSKASDDSNDDGNVVAGEDEDLRMRLRQVEAERDEAQRIVRDVKAYLLDERAGRMGPV